MAAETTKRFELLDFWRILSAMAIVWLHTPESALLSPTTRLTRYAVPFFVVSASYMACRVRPSETRGSFVAFIRSRIERIYLPFLGWSAIYLLVRYVASSFVATVRPYPLTWDLLWRGPTSHLWFLPFILVATILASGIGRLISARRVTLWPVVALLMATSSLPLLRPDLSEGFAYTADLAYNTLPAMFWGIAMAAFCSETGTQWLSRPPIILTAISLFVATQIGLAITDRNMLLENLAGLFLLLGCFGGSHHPWFSRVASYGSLAYGVYLSHMLFVEGLQDIRHACKLAVSPIADITVFFLSAAGSLLLTVSLRKIRWLSWLVP